MMPSGGPAMTWWFLKLSTTKVTPVTTSRRGDEPRRSEEHDASMMSPLSTTNNLQPRGCLGVRTPCRRRSKRAAVYVRAKVRRRVLVVCFYFFMIFFFGPIAISRSYNE